MKKSLFHIFSTLFLFAFFIGNSQQLMTRAQVYDYDVGDVFEYQMEWGSTGGEAHVDSIMGKHYSINFDTVFYTLNTYSVVFAQCPPPCTSSYSSSIGQIAYYTNLTDTVGAGLGTKPYDLWGCIDTAGFTGTYMDTTYYNSYYCGKLTTEVVRLSNGPYQLSDTCYAFFEPYYENWEYGMGLGQIYHSINTCSNGFPNCSSSQYLRYYKKGNDSCGTYLNVLPVGFKELSVVNETLTIVPNPVCDKFIIESTIKGKYEISIYTLSGVRVSSKTIKEKEEMNISELEDGIYFIQIKTSNTIFTKKLIVEKGK